MGNKPDRQGRNPQLHDARLTWAFEKHAVSIQSQKEQILNPSAFQAMFVGQPVIGQLLLEHFVREKPDLANGFSLDQFIVCCQSLLDLVSTSQQMEFYIRVLLHSKENLDKQDVRSLFSTLFGFEFSLLGITQEDLSPDDKLLSSVVSTIFAGDHSSVDVSSVMRYTSQQLQGAFVSLHAYVTSALRGFNNTPFPMPVTEAGASCASSFLDHSNVLSPSLSWALSCTLGPTHLPESSVSAEGEDNKHNIDSALSKVLKGWNCLYSSDLHGLSPNRLVHHVFSYKGPTILLVNMEGFAYCMAIDDEWLDGTKAFGGDHSLLMQISPHYKAVNTEPGMILFNSHSRVALKGLIVGKQTPRIFQIDELFDSATHYGIPQKLLTVEVWGCGGISALQMQKAQKDWENKEVEKAKNRKLKIDDWSDSPDRQILEMGGVKTEHAER